jgi:glycine cleavage system aminomethyltransferase T
VSAPSRRSPLTESHRELGARFVVEAGWEMVASYEREGSLASSPLALAEITQRAKVDVRGEVAGSFAASANELVAAVASDWSLVLGAPGTEDEILPRLAAAAGNDEMVTDATHLYVGFALIGDRLEDLLSRLTAFDHSWLKPGSAAAAPILDVPAILVRRAGPLPVVETYVGTEFARFVWSRILRTSTDLGGGPVGWSALRAAGWS